MKQFTGTVGYMHAMIGGKRVRLDALAYTANCPNGCYTEALYSFRHNGKTRFILDCRNKGGYPFDHPDHGDTPADSTSELSRREAVAWCEAQQNTYTSWLIAKRLIWHDSSYANV